MVLGPGTQKVYENMLAENEKKARIAKEQADAVEKARIAKEQADAVEKARIAKEQADAAEKARLAKSKQMQQKVNSQRRS